MYDEDIRFTKSPTRKKRGRPKKEIVVEDNKIEKELVHGYEANGKLDREICEDFKYIDEEVIEEKIEEKIEEVIEEKIEEKIIEIKEIKKVVKIKKGPCKYYGTWIGRRGNNLRAPGVGKIIPGKEIEISEKTALALKNSPNWSIRTSYEYE